MVVVNVPGVLPPRLEQLQLRGAPQAELLETADAITRRSFGKAVFVRGVVEVSNYCREDCRYCGMRRSNRDLHRFRSDAESLAHFLIEHRPPVVTDINIQTGEDPLAVREVVIPMIRLLRRHTSLGLSVCLGTLDEMTYKHLREAGASIYIMKFEAANPVRYAELAAPGTLAERLNHIHHLADTGWNVSSGFIAGLPGEEPADSRANVKMAARLPLQGCSVSPFIPGDQTPVSSMPHGEIDLTLNSMALLRLLQPGWVIPAVSALNLSQPGTGYRRGLRAGANLVTINLTPEHNRDDYLLYTRNRFIMTTSRVLDAIEAEGLHPSKRSLTEFYAEASRARSAATSPTTAEDPVAPAHRTGGFHQVRHPSTSSNRIQARSAPNIGRPLDGSSV